jgi:hypothetical protein
MGIRVTCPNGHRLNLKNSLAGRRGVCPHCGAKFVIPGSEDAAPVATDDVVVSAEAARPRGASTERASEAEHRVEPVVVRPTQRPVEPPPLGPGFPVVTDSVRPAVRVRRRRRRTPVQWVVWLTIAVVVLAAVFVWILNR